MTIDEEAAALFKPHPSDRVVYIGPTGSGKTELARRVEIQFPNEIVIDPKHRFSWEQDSPRYLRVAHSLRDLVAHLKQIEDRRTGEPVIYRPPAIAPEHIDPVYDLAYQRGFTHVYNDDFAACVYGAANVQKYLPAWFRCVTLGRQRGVGISASIQRPANVPLVAMSESDYRVTFYLRMRNDQKRAEELCGPIDWPFLAANDYSFVWATDKVSSDPMRLRLCASSPLQATA